MKVVLKRIYSSTKFTLGVFSIDGKTICYTIEDIKQAVKVYGETRIPAGVYQMTEFNGSRFTKSYKSKIKGHGGMLLIQNVPNFSGILIHAGNSSKDTAGCILPGLTHEINKDFIGSSFAAYGLIYFPIIDKLRANKKVFIEIIDEN